MSTEGQLHEQKDGPITSYCWGPDYLIPEEVSEPWQAEIEGPDGVVVQCASGASREEAISRLKDALPGRALALRQEAVRMFEMLSQKAQALEDALNPNPEERSAFGVRGFLLEIPPGEGNDGHHVFRVHGQPVDQRDFRFSMEDCEVIVATDYAVLYNVDGNQRLDFPKPTAGGRKLIEKLEESL